ncbi:MAG: baseplate J/gp47 family protein, partial [Chloroflexia bacterium]
APAQQPGIPPPRTRPRQTSQLGAPRFEFPALSPPDEPTLQSRANSPALAAATPATPAAPVKARRVVPASHNGRFRYGGRVRSTNWGKLLTLIVSLLVVALVGGSAYAYVYLPEGVVSVTPLNQVREGIPIEVSVLTGPLSQPPGKAPAVPPAGQADTSNPQSQTAPTINAGAISTTLQEEGTRSASGTRQIPHGKAQGFMRFTNRTGSAVTVPSGTQFKASNGVSVQTTQAGTVPPTVFGQSFGTLDLPIAATIEGPDGNIPAGQVSGIHGGTLNYTNLALQGGSTDTVKVVSQADIDSLVADLRARVEARKAGAMLDMTPAGFQLITQTIELSDVQFQTDRKAKQDGDTVTAHLTSTVQAKVYKDTDMSESITQAVTDVVQSSIPQAAAPSLDLGSVQFSPPVLKSLEPGRALYSTTASGRVSFALTEEMVRQIRDLVHGKDLNQARALINQTYGAYISPDSIDAHVLWFTLDKLPNNPSRINVQPTGAQRSPP